MLPGSTSLRQTAPLLQLQGGASGSTSCLTVESACSNRHGYSTSDIFGQKVRRGREMVTWLKKKMDTGCAKNSSITLQVGSQASL